MISVFFHGAAPVDEEAFVIFIGKGKGYVLHPAIRYGKTRTVFSFFDFAK